MKANGKETLCPKGYPTACCGGISFANFFASREVILLHYRENLKWELREDGWRRRNWRRGVEYYSANIWQRRDLVLKRGGRSMWRLSLMVIGGGREPEAYQTSKGIRPDQKLSSELWKLRPRWELERLRCMLFRLRTFMNEPEGRFWRCFD